ncbi:carboxylesterase/lipase family protein [Spirosoma oryzicola]|uniref:carboxylesterase/lipase family protein n=1 Tax=Spirosoma oryzicola TaxID=2898794 RepID=UPI001E5DEAF0|nr:carboxylesterase family protein [Spirosoma oryzicola]UHG89416.1 carboxylesterase family protein [Spirosoma oryzicola]
MSTGDSALVAFKGIPFAAPPIGNLRWQPPQPALKWEGVKACTDFGPSPMQPTPAPFGVYTPEFLVPAEPISEDCLYLNVWTGAKSSSEKRPVFVWLYGGAFSSGGSAVPIYDGEALARKGVIFVSINYRVGIFGFFAHPDLSKESSTKTSGNYGLLDQIAALQWIQRNIAAFGGDPLNVTIAGQSAGSRSVNCLLASPLAWGLFHKAIAESGSSVLANSTINTTSLLKAEEQGVTVATALHASSPDKLRAIPAQELLQQVQERFGPIVDGYVLPQSIATIFGSGEQAKVPLLTGWNADDGGAPTDRKQDEFRRDLQRQYGAFADDVLRYYPASTDEQAGASQAALHRDLTYALPTYKLAQMQSEAGKSPVYVYHFAHKPPATGNFLQYGAFHTAEVAYALNNLAFLKRPWQAIDRELANQLSSYWVNFAKTGNPNGSNLPQWPSYTATNADIMLFGDKPIAQKLLGNEVLDFLYSKTISH